MNQRFFIFYDFETGSVNPYTCQPIQIAAVAIHPRSLKIDEDNIFETYIKHYSSDDECSKHNVEPLQAGALAKNKINVLDLETAPRINIVLDNLSKWLKNYSNGDRPVRIGYNNHCFDDIILDRYCEQYGYWQKARQESKLFYRRSLDLMELLWMWTENTDIDGASFDDMRTWLGLSREGAHKAGKDVMDGAMVFVRFLKYMRAHSKDDKFRGSFSKK